MVTSLARIEINVAMLNLSTRRFSQSIAACESARPFSDRRA